MTFFVTVVKYPDLCMRAELLPVSAADQSNL